MFHPRARWAKFLDKSSPRFDDRRSRKGFSTKRHDATPSRDRDGEREGRGREEREPAFLRRAEDDAREVERALVEEEDAVARDADRAEPLGRDRLQGAAARGDGAGEERRRRKREERVGPGAEGLAIERAFETERDNEER